MKIRKITTLLMMIPLLTALTGCATIVHGTCQSVGISSTPSDAAIWLDRMYVGDTPAIVSMTRKDNHIVRIELDGYQPYEVIFCRKVSGWFFGNVVFGGLIGIAVDAVSGGVYKLTPSQVCVELQSNNMAFSKQTNDSYIGIVLKADPSWEKIGNLQLIN